MNRREMLATLGLVAAGGSLFAAPPTSAANPKPGVPIFNVRDFGATGDGQTLDTAAINRAITACHASGGGVAYLPPGTYLCGTVILQSNVTLYLEAGATILGSKNIRDYAPQEQKPDAKPGESTAFVNDLRDAGAYHLIFARDAENVGVAGPGLIDGQGSAYWASRNRVQPPPSDAWEDVIAFDWMAKPPRPSPMLEFYNCRNLRLEDVRLENSAGWTLRPISCDNVFIRGISIKNPVYGPNCDGIDATCCRNLFIADCLIDTGDDAICLKSESPYGGEPRVSKNITITNCVLTGCCNGLKFGTAAHGGYENITFSNSVIFNDDVPLGSRLIAGLALEMVDGGYIDGVLISNIRMQRVRTPIFIRRGNRHPRPDGTPGLLRSVMIDNLHASNAILTSSITGLPGFEVEDVTLSNIRIDSDEGGSADWVKLKIPELAGAYPEARQFGRLPGYGLYCRHVTGLRMRHLEFRSAAAEARPAIVCDDARDVEIDGLRSRPIVGGEPVVKLVQARQALLRNCSAPAGTKVFLEVQGAQSDGVVLMSSDLLGAEQAVRAGAEVPAAAVTVAGNLGPKAA